MLQRKTKPVNFVSTSFTLCLLLPVLPQQTSRRKAIVNSILSAMGKLPHHRNWYCPASLFWMIWHWPGPAQTCSCWACGSVHPTALPSSDKSRDKFLSAWICTAGDREHEHGECSVRHQGEPAAAGKGSGGPTAAPPQRAASGRPSHTATAQPAAAAGGRGAAAKPVKTERAAFAHVGRKIMLRSCGKRLL